MILGKSPYLKLLGITGDRVSGMRAWPPGCGRGGGAGRLLLADYRALLPFLKNDFKNQL